MVACAFHSSYTRGINRKIVVQASPGKNARPCLKNNSHKKVRGVAQVVKHLLNKLRALSLKPQYQRERESSTFISKPFFC
jgi:hypothetical protein